MNDLTPSNLRQLVLDKISEIGDEKAREFFAVSAGTISAWKNRKNDPSLDAAQRAWDASLICQKPEIWDNPESKVAIMLPMYETVEPYFLVSLLRSLRSFGMDKVSVIPKTRTLIDEARNDLINTGLATAAEYFIMGDCDMILPCGNAGMMRKMGCNYPDAKMNVNAINRLMSHPADKLIVGGLYIDRRGVGKVQCAKAFGSPAENERLRGLFTGKTQADGLEESGGWVAMGLVRFHRSVFERMKAEAVKPGSILADICPPPPPRDKEPWGFFGRSSRFRGEDIAVCRRAESIGITTFIDTGLLCGHIGRAVY